MTIKKAEIPKLEFKYLFMTLIVLASLWGFSEVVMNEWIRSFILPLRAAILTGIGMLTMGLLLGVLKRPLTLIILPFIVIALKQLVVPILGMSVLCKANSCAAVALQAFALAGAYGIFMRRGNPSLTKKAATGASAALVSSISFFLIGLKLAPCKYLLSYNQAGGFMSFMVNEGLIWTLLAAISFPVGFWLGEKLRQPVLNYARKKPGFYYSYSAGLVISCWVAIALTIAAAG
jgi:hypothetical protein